jgi:hypothetical protein
MASHAQRRAQERYQITGELPFGEILALVRDGKAKLVSFGKGSGLIYDVPLDCPAYTGTLRVIVREDLNWVLTVVPPKTPGEIYNDRRREMAQQSAAKRKQLHKEFRRENANED